MDTKKLLIIVGVVVLIIFLANESRFLIWDSFGKPPKGTSPNCGPTGEYDFDVTINSKQDFINFLKEYDGKILDKYGNNWVRLDNFKEASKSGDFNEVRDRLSNVEVDWDEVLSAVEVESNGAILFHQKVYILNYNPFTCSGFTLKATESGKVSVYGCCGI